MEIARAAVVWQRKHMNAHGLTNFGDTAPRWHERCESERIARILNATFPVTDFENQR